MSTPDIRKALAELVAAFDADQSPEWKCNSLHPRIWPAVEYARAALAAPQQAAPAGQVEAPLQGGLGNAELLAAWGMKLPGVQPSDRELSAFALGVEVGFDHARNLERQDWSRVHHVLAKHGVHPGRTDDHLADVIDRALSASEAQAARKPDFWGFVNEDDCRIELCFTPTAPSSDGRMAVPIWIEQAPAAEAVQPKTLDNPRLQELFSATIDGALTTGYQGGEAPPAGHWLTYWYEKGRAVAQAEAVQPPAQAVRLTDDAALDLAECLRPALATAREWGMALAFARAVERAVWAANGLRGE